jgi:hypothetical protein
MTNPANHPFVIEQREGVSAPRMAEWVSRLYHPGMTLFIEGGTA